MPPATEPTQKQQITELLKSATNVVITTGKNPSVDAYSAVIALAQMLEKMGKRSEAVVSSSPPRSLDFLPTHLISNKFTGLRDFVIELDISKTEADKLKYVPEGKRLKIYITPYNGNFSKEDLGFSYGQYHCDGIIAMGVNNVQELDSALGSQKQLLEKTKLVLVSAGSGTPSAPANGLVWNEPAATSLSEMLMSLSEALQPGILDNNIATALLTGIMDTTQHFTAPNTTPKVMTMAAQLMAAGASQTEIVKHLQGSSGKGQKADGKPRDLEANGTANLPHPAQTKDNDKNHQQPQSNFPSAKPEAVKPSLPPVTPTPAPSFAPPAMPPGMPPLPSGAPPFMPPAPISQVRVEHDGNPFATVAGSPLNTPNPAATSPVVNSSPSQGGLVSNDHKPIDLEAARRAVEEASRATPTAPPPPPPNMQPPSPTPQ